MAEIHWKRDGDAYIGMLSVELDIEPRWKCQECEALLEEKPESALYECSCGTMFTRETSYNDNHQCPDCYKMASRYADLGCSECNQGEVEEIEVVVCDCGDVVELDELDGHMTVECRV